MNRSNIKNIMIVLLALINVFLIGDMAVTNYRTYSLPREMRQSVVSILDKNGIRMDPSLMPKSYEKRPAAEVTFFSIDALSEALLGERCGYKSDGQNIIAEKDGCTLSVNGRSFSYRTEKSAVRAGDGKIMKAIKDAGLSNPGAVCENGVVKVRIGGFEVEGLFLEAALSEDGQIASLSGTWGSVKLNGESEKASFASAVPSVLKALPSGGSVKKLEGVYVIEGSGQNYVLKPAWKITAGEEEYIVS